MRIYKSNMLPCIFNIIAMLAILLVSCAQLGPEKEWNNPFDPQGVNYYPPAIHQHPDTSVLVNKPLPIAIEASDQNGTIAGFIWSFNRGAKWDTVKSAAPFSKTWGLSDTGYNPVWFRAIDNDGLVSKVDSFKVFVFFFAPILVKHKDTLVSQKASVPIVFSATDTKGTIVKYYWKTSLADNSWSDSSETPKPVFSKPQGGPLDIVWGAIDNDGILTTDTFSILFNRGPDSVNIVPIPVAFDSFDYDEYKGILKLTFNATDPDGPKDTLTYTVSMSKTGSAPVQVYTGTSGQCIIPGLDPTATYSWSVKVKDLYGDTTGNSGSFTTPKSPSDPRGMKLIRSKKARFIMGQNGFAPYEQPAHEVSFTYHFWMDSTEVTNGDFNTALGISDSNTSDDKLPVSGVNWYDAIIYCNARSKADKLDTVYSYTGITGKPGSKCVCSGLTISTSKKGYRLPTEAEWEFACRAGTGTLFFWGNSIAGIENYAWVKESGVKQPHPTAQKKPNAYGLYDMSGNAFEWCNDWFDPAYYTASAIEDPTGPATGTERALRGGSYLNTEYFAQPGTRSKLQPQLGQTTTGFRVVLVVK